MLFLSLQSSCIHWSLFGILLVGFVWYRNRMWCICISYFCLVRFPHIDRLGVQYSFCSDSGVDFYSCLFVVFGSLKYVITILVKPAMWLRPSLVRFRGWPTQPPGYVVLASLGKRGTDGVSAWPDGWYQAALCSAGDQLRGLNSMMPGDLVHRWFRWLVTSSAKSYPTFPWKKAFPLLVFWLGMFIKL